jgi:choline dehydrogenase
LIDLEGWTYQEVLPYFRKSETFMGSNVEEKRGTDGPMIIGSFAPNDATVAAVETAAEVFGVPAVDDNNGGRHESVSITQVRG